MATKATIEKEAHPIIAALEKVDEPVVEIHGFLGTSDGEVVRLYQALDTSTYVEIPTAAIAYFDSKDLGETGSVRVFACSSCELLSVRRRRIPAGDWKREPRELPPVQVGTFWTCAGECEKTYAKKLAEIKNGGLTPEQANHEIYKAGLTLHGCLSICVDKFGAPPLMPDDSAPSGFRFKAFSLSAYHTMILNRHLGTG